MSKLVKSFIVGIIATGITYILEESVTYKIENKAEGSEEENK